VSRLCVDSWAWLELLKGSRTGAAVKRHVSASAEVLTTAPNLFEVLYRTTEDKGAEAASKALELILNHAEIIPIGSEIAVKAVSVRKEEKLHAIDALSFAAAMLNGALFLTGDAEFRGKKGVIFIE